MARQTTSGSGPFEVEVLTSDSARLRPISTRWLVLAALVTTAMVTAGTVFYVGEDSHDAGAGPVTDAIAGVHVLQQVSSVARLNSYASQITTALQVPGVTTFGVRVPWNTVDTSWAILDRAREIADGTGDQLAVRFMAGEHTPNRVRDVCPMLGSGVDRFPRPFDAAGVTNQCFVTEYRLFVERLAVWARANDVHMLHLSHYAKDWAEFYFGLEVQGIMGNTAAAATAMVNATNALVDVGIAVSGSDLAAELPMSGHGLLMRNSPTSPPGIAERVTQHVVAVLGQGSDRFFIQGNGWDEDGIWGAPSAATEANMDFVLGYGALLGVQMIQPQQYNWTAVFNVAEAKQATYAEIYLPSFTTGTAAQIAQLRAEIGSFVPHVPGGPPPPTTTTSVPPTTTTVAPTTTTLPPTTTTTLPPTTTTTVDPDDARIAELEAEVARLLGIIDDATAVLAAASPS